MKAGSLLRTRRSASQEFTETTTPGNGNGNPDPLAKAPDKVKAVPLVQLERAPLLVTVVSETGLIVHEFSEKSKKQMLDKQMGKATKGREKKVPLDDFKSSLYKFPGKEEYGFPARGFKACFVRAANDVDLVKTEMKRAIRVLGTGDEAMNVDGLIKIEAPPLPRALYSKWDIEYEKELEPYHKVGISMREDVVRLETGVADIRFRAFYPFWTAKVQVHYNRRAVSEEQLLALIDAAGFGVGIGEWRPGAPKSESGQFGCFHVKLGENVQSA